jgi:hypothetical protein
VNLQILSHRSICYILKTEAMQGVAALESNNLIIMSEEGIDLCFDNKVFLYFDNRILLLIQVFQHCIVINTTNIVVEQRSKYFTNT